MKSDLNFETYQSPFSWRYGSEEMRQIFSEINKRKTWRKVWVALARAQHKLELVSASELSDIERHQNEIDITKAHQIEDEIKHDLMAELKTYAAQAKTGGGKLHLGATSQDIEDNADVLIIKKALRTIESKLTDLLSAFAGQIEGNKDLVCMAYTHLQPAQPTTLGYRFAFYAQDLLIDWQLLQFVKTQIKGKGAKGAVGTAAGYVALLGQKAQTMESLMLDDLGIEAFDVTNQIYPRKIDYLIIVVLSGIAASLHKFAFDVRIMQSPGFGEWMEPFGKTQVGSSAMPFKRNPQSAERICSLARYIAALPKVTWDNAANSLLERTLDDSAARRISIPDAFLAADEILMLTTKIVKGLIINKKNVEANLEKYGPFAACENLMMQAVKNGADRQKIHEVMRKLSMQAWQDIGEGKSNPLINLLQKDRIMLQFVGKNQIKTFIDPAHSTGLSQKYCQDFLKKLKSRIK